MQDISHIENQLSANIEIYNLVSTLKIKSSMTSSIGTRCCLNSFSFSIANLFLTSKETYVDSATIYTPKKLLAFNIN